MPFEEILTANTVALNRHADLLQQFIDAGIPAAQMPAMRATSTPAEQIATTNTVQPAKRGPGRPPARAPAPVEPAPALTAALPTKDDVKAALFRVRDVHGEAAAKSIILSAGRVEKMDHIPPELRASVIAACEVALDDSGAAPEPDEDAL